METVKRVSFGSGNIRITVPRNKLLKDSIAKSLATPASYEYQAMKKFNDEDGLWEQYKEVMGKDKKSSTEYGLITVLDKDECGYFTNRLKPEYISVLMAIFTLLHKDGKLMGDENGKFQQGEDSSFTLADISYLMTGVKKRRHREKDKFDLKNYETEYKISKCIESMQGMVIAKTTITLPKGKTMDKEALENLQSEHMNTLDDIGNNEALEPNNGYIPSKELLLPVNIKANVRIDSMDKVKYDMLAVPLIFVRAERLSRVMRIPLENIRVVSEKVNKKMLTIVIRDFLFYRIAKLCNDGGNEQRIKTIKLDSLYEYVDTWFSHFTSESEKKHMKEKIRKLVDAILKAWESEKEDIPKDVTELQKHYIFGKKSYLISHKFIRDANHRGNPFVSIDLQFDAETEKFIAKKEREAKENAQRKAAQAAKKAAKQAIKEAEAAKAELKKGTENHE